MGESERCVDMLFNVLSCWCDVRTRRLIKTLFAMAREQKKAVIFIDELDSIGGKRSEGENEGTRRIKTELLIQMVRSYRSEGEPWPILAQQGVGNDQTGVLVLGCAALPPRSQSMCANALHRATNLPWQLDSGIMRR